MPSFIEGLGQGAATQVASGAIQAGMGLLLEKHEDKRQVKQQQKLTDMQIAAAKNMGEYNYEKQMQLWHDTNFKAQSDELAKAGMNRGLLYGMQGGGGTTADFHGGTASGGSAASQSGEIIGQNGMGMQTGMMAAQIDLLKSEAELNRVEAQKKSGVDTENVQASTASLLQGVNNLKAQEFLTRTQQRLLDAQAKVAEGTVEEQIRATVAEMTRAEAEATIAENDNQISRATWEDKVQIIKQDLAGKIITNELNKLYQKQTRATTRNIEGQTSKIPYEKVMLQKQIVGLIQDNEQSWQYLNNTERQTRVQEALKDLQLDMQGVREITNIISQVFDGVLRHTPGQRPPKVGFR